MQIYDVIHKNALGFAAKAAGAHPIRSKEVQR
jgi:hypothetical protein